MKLPDAQEKQRECCLLDRSPPCRLDTQEASEVTYQVVLRNMGQRDLAIIDSLLQSRGVQIPFEVQEQSQGKSRRGVAVVEPEDSALVSTDVLLRATETPPQ